MHKIFRRTLLYLLPTPRPDTGDQQLTRHYHVGALVGGVGLLLNHEPTLMFQKAGMLAPDGRCKTLNASADGYVR
jgi:acyl transferase domain-containing protein